MNKQWSLICLILCLSALLLACSSDNSTINIPSTTDNPVLWDAAPVRLQADDFYLEAVGVKYLANVSNVAIGSGGGDSSITLELEWEEHNVEMRLYIYLRTSAGFWWGYEIRTYDGAMNDGTRWVYYYGEFFKSAVGSSFTGNIDLTNDGSDNNVVGKLHFKNINMSAY